MPTSQTKRPASKTRYEYKPPEAEMRATEPNPYLEGISSGLGYLRDSLDTGNILDVATLGPVRRLLNGEPTRTAPPTTHAGPGSLMMGHAPEEIHEWASGFSPFSEEPNYGNRLDPRIKAGREQGVVDVGFLADSLAGMGLASLRGGVSRGIKSIGMKDKSNPVGGILDTQSVRNDGTDAVVHRGRLPLVHGSGNSALNLNDIDIFRTGQRQAQRSTPVGGFYMSNPEDLAHAEGYAKMGNRGAAKDASVTPTIYDMGVRQGTKVLKINGSTDRLSQDYIRELQAQGYGLVVGKDVRGRTEYVAIDKNALESMTPRGVKPNVNPDAPANMSRREFMGNTGKAAAGLAAASAVPFVLRGAEHAAPAVVEHAIPTALAPATHMEYTAARELALQDILPKIKAWEELNPEPSNAKAHNEWFLKREAELIRLEKEAVVEVRANKRYEGFRTPNDAYEDMKEEAKKIRRKYGLPEHLDDVDSYMVSSYKDQKYLRSKYPENWDERVHNMNDELRVIMDNYHDNYPIYDPKNPMHEFYHISTDETDPDLIRRIKEAGGRLYDPNTHEYLYVDHENHISGNYNGEYINVGQSTPDELREFIKNAQTPKPKKAAGGSVTMPDNYRSGGRVRMI